MAKKKDFTARVNSNMAALDERVENMKNTAPPIKLKLDIENIGPHSAGNKLNFQADVDSLKAVFYASNGTGKSFISRSFRLLLTDKKDKTADELLTLGQAMGNMRLWIADDTQTPPVNKQLSIQVSRGNTPVIANRTEYIFHVFNSEYVDENIKPRDYTPDGNIDGYILGKVQIDLTEDKKQEAKIKEELENKEKEIDLVVLAAQKELRDNGIRQNQTEYSLINKEHLRNLQQIACDKSFNEIVTQLQKLAKLPDDMPDVAPLSFSFDADVFDEIDVLLKTEYPKSEWDDDFTSKIKSKRDFIIEGLTLVGDDEEACPFCGQKLGNDALALIGQYKEYLNDKESQVLNKIDNIAQKVKAIETAIRGLSDSINDSIINIDKLKNYFPSLGDTGLKQVDVSEDVLACLRVLYEALQKKSTNLRATDFQTDNSIKAGKQIIETTKSLVVQNTKHIQDINSLKNNSNTERLALRRNLCNAKYIQLIGQLEEPFKAICGQKAELKALGDEIAKKEEQSRVSKKRKVFETLKYFLDRFFAGKYTIDEDIFQLKFQNIIQPKASSVLSDGEKNIVAFCFYLASTYLMVERDDDYNKLFFVVDDPVSSMDFNFVYAIAQSLRDMKDHFGIEKRHYRVFVFTHNLEFYNIITRNHIITQAYIMKPGKIEKLKEQLLMPYENHLFDIVNIANGQEKPSHTTGNSIRHVLETVSKFEYPKRNLEEYIAENNTLKDNSCIFSLCQDLSHGAIRTQPPFDEQVLTEACKVVVTFMEQRYHGQIEAIKPKTDTTGMI